MFKKIFCCAPLKACQCHTKLGATVAIPLKDLLTKSRL